MCTYSKEFKVFQNAFLWDSRKFYRLTFSFSSENLLFRNISNAVRSGFGTVLLLIKSEYINLHQVFQHSPPTPKKLSWNTQHPLFGV
jgi:hypothetical protein